MSQGTLRCSMNPSVFLSVTQIHLSKGRPFPGRSFSGEVQFSSYSEQKWGLFNITTDCFPCQLQNRHEIPQHSTPQLLETVVSRKGWPLSVAKVHTAWQHWPPPGPSYHQVQARIGSQPTTWPWLPPDTRLSEQSGQAFFITEEGSTALRP